MNDNLTKEAMEYIIARLIDNARDAVEEDKENKNSDKELFYSGRRLAYYEVLDIIKSELNIHSADLKQFGLNFNLEKEIA